MKHRTPAHRNPVVSKTQLMVVISLRTIPRQYDNDTDPSRARSPPPTDIHGGGTPLASAGLQPSAHNDNDVCHYSATSACPDHCESVNRQG